MKKNIVIEGKVLATEENGVIEFNTSALTQEELLKMVQYLNDLALNIHTGEYDLTNYKQYCVWMSKNHPNKDIMDEEEFELRRKFDIPHHMAIDIINERKED